MKEVQKNVKKHLLKFGSITDLQCLNKYGGRRLAAVICRLRNKGMNIKTIMMDQRNSSSKYAKYQIVKP